MEIKSRSDCILFIIAINLFLIMNALKYKIEKNKKRPLIIHIIVQADCVYILSSTQIDVCSSKLSNFIEQN